MYTPTTCIDNEYQLFVKFKSFYPILLMSTVHALMEGHALTKSMATHAPAALASLVPTASMRSMNVIPSPASMGASVKMLLIPSDVPAPKVFSAIAVRYTQTLICQAFLTLCTFRCLNVVVFKIYLYDRLQSTGADAHLLAKMEAGVDKKMLHLSVNVPMAGLDATATSEGSPVKQLLDKEVCLS